MNILLIDHFNEPDPGGGQYYLLQTAEALRSNGWKVSLICVPNSCVSKLFKGSGFSVFETNFFTKLIPVDFLRLYKSVAELNPDIVICQSFYEVFLCYLISKILRKPSYLRIFHTEAFPRYAERRFKRLLLSLRSVFEARIFRNLKFIAVSEYVAKQLRKVEVNSYRLRVVEPTFLLDRLLASIKEEKRGILSKKGIVVAGCGRLVKLKDFETLVSCVEILARKGFDISATIFGSGAEEARLKEKAKELGIEDKIYLAGYVKNWWEYPFDVYVTTSLSESFPMSLMTAVISGYPCVASNIAAHKEILGNSYKFLFEPKNPESLAEILEWIYFNREEALEVAEHTRLSVIKRYGTESFDKKIFQAITYLSGVETERN